MRFLIRIIVISVNAFLLAYLLPGVDISDFSTAIVVAFVLAVLDALVKPLLVLLTLPVTVLTFGLFLFVINAIIILLDAYIVHGFKVNSIWHAMLFSVFLSIANSLVPGKRKQDEKQAR